MIKLISTIAILILLTGCTPSKLNYVSYGYAECMGKGNVGVKLVKGVYRCINSKHQVKKTYRTVPKVKKVTKYTFKNPSWLNTAPITKCETTVTTIYKDGSVRCKGKILPKGGVSKIIKVKG
mgnify:CR=1 FL=1